MPVNLTKSVITTIMIAVKTMLRLIATVSSSRLALLAAAVAIAADTPHTLISALIVMLSDLEAIFNIF